MEDKHRFDKITLPNLQLLCDEYEDVVPSKLTDLDQQRYTAIPAEITKMKPSGPAFLTLDQVTTLVEWKLSHGTFRPTLKALVRKNDDTFVQTTTQTAFETASANLQDAERGLRELVKLKGVGPATASLLLSVFDLDRFPFFSDELYRWCMFQNAKGCAWDRPIKYTSKEFIQMTDSVHQLQKRLETESGEHVSAANIEKAAYVLGKRPMSNNQRDETERDLPEKLPRKRQAPADVKPTQPERKRHKNEKFEAQNTTRRRSSRIPKKAA